MDLTKIVQKVNNKLAGEMLTYDMMKDYLDDVIDDINARLSTNFPVFSDFTLEAYPDMYPDYAFFPDRYIRSVVTLGAAYKFFVVDEEGLPTAQQFSYEYQDALFIMERDYSDLIPEEFRLDLKASLYTSTTALSETPFDFHDL